MNICELYIKGWREGKNGCADDAISGQVYNTMSGRVMMRDMRGGTCGFLCLADKATLRPGGHVASLPLRWAAEDKEQMKFPSAVIVTDCEIGSEMRLPRVEIVADCEIGS